MRKNITIKHTFKYTKFSSIKEGLDGGVLYSLFIKILAHYSSH